LFPAFGLPPLFADLTDEVFGAARFS